MEGGTAHKCHSHGDGNLNREETGRLGPVLGLDLKNESYGGSSPDWLLQM